LWWCLVVAGCGPPSVAHPDQCPLITGTFKAHSTLESADGSCGQAKAKSFDSYTFDSKGAFVSPLEGVVRCNTVQEDCAITIHCTTDVIHAKADFSGMLSEDGATLTGTATFSGSYQGCSKVTYRVEGSHAVLAERKKIVPDRPLPKK
jgi:hypothetical protein